MPFTEVIARKRDGRELLSEDIERFVKGATEGSIPSEQLAALLMAICIRGMTASEVHLLTTAMLRSGQQWKLSEDVPDAVDKHSTGGIGDTVSLIFAPLTAAVGTPVAMMAGRGLGHSQGTLDKLEAIPGFRVSWDRSGMLDLLSACGAAIIAQTSDVAPADRVLYALRDVTATVPSLPLIVASIMSKKLALGAGSLILDVKCGSGAFRKNLPDAVELATALRQTARDAGVSCRALVTEMDQPLGPFLGTACEVREAVAVLEGRGSARLRELTLRLAEEILVEKGRVRTEARGELEEALDSGKALRKWEEMVRAHGGDPDPGLLARPEEILEITADAGGFLQAVDGESLGWAAVEIGAGRRRLGEEIDPGAGIEILVQLGEKIDRGRPLARILRGKRAADIARLSSRIGRAFRIGEEPPVIPPLVYGSPEECSV